MAVTKGRRMASAVLFLFGVFASMRALSDATVAWPLATLWAQLNNPHKFQLCGGIASMLVACIMFFMRRSETTST